MEQEHAKKLENLSKTSKPGSILARIFNGAEDPLHTSPKFVSSKTDDIESIDNGIISDRLDNIGDFSRVRGSRPELLQDEYFLEKLAAHKSARKYEFYLEFLFVEKKYE